VPFLAETAASAEKGPVQDAARRALGGVPGRAVDDAIVVSLMQPASDAIAVELLKAVADRRVFLAKPAVSASLLASSAAVRIEGKDPESHWLPFGRVSGPGDIPEGERRPRAG
jgi:hypothetical protein